MVHRVLFVCTANVCRSPLMETVFRAAITPVHWTVHSAGTSAVASAKSMCGTAAAIAGVSADSHRAEGIDVEMAAVQDLVITASRAERGAMGVLVPQLRWRTFTLREVLLLGSTPPTTAERSMAEKAQPGADVLHRFADILHRRRGRIDPPPVRRSLFSTSRLDPLDIRDVHAERDGVHFAVLDETAAEVRALAELLLAEIERAGSTAPRADR